MIAGIGTTNSPVGTWKRVKTGSRTILSYLLSPLLRYRQETLRER
jgi:hypothetical protein